MKDAKMMTFPGRVLITGATGFIGARLLEVMQLTNTFQPRAFIHSTASAWRITRFPLDFALGDLCDYDAVERAVQGCDAVVHLAFGDRAVARKGTENILRAAARAGVSRFVHVSSVAVYGNNPPAASVTEDAPAHPTSLAYGNEKLHQELLVQKYGKRRKLPFVILRPPNVCGPFSPFSLNLIQKIRSGAMAIVDGGQNPCNLVYVDNLVEAILLSLWKEEAIGQTFFVTNSEIVTWKQCIEDHAVLTGSSVPQIKSSELVPAAKERLFRDSVRSFPRVVLSGELRSMLRRVPLFRLIEQAVYGSFLQLLPEMSQRLRFLVSGPTIVPSDSPSRRFSAADGLLMAQGRRVAHSNRKAQTLLGYSAPVSYREGMALTEAWLRFAKAV